MVSVNRDWVKATILYHLRNKEVIGGAHTPFDTLGKRFPKHLIGEAKDVAKELIKEGKLITKPTSYGLQVSLNKEMLLEIEAFIAKTLGFNFEK